MYRFKNLLTLLSTDRRNLIYIFMVLICVTLLPLYIPLRNSHYATLTTLGTTEAWAYAIPFLCIAVFLFIVKKYRSILLYLFTCALLGLIAAAFVYAVIDRQMPRPNSYEGVLDALYFLVIPLIGSIFAARAAYQIRIRRNAKLRLRIAAQKETRRQKRLAHVQKIQDAVKIAPSTNVNYERGALFAIGGPILGIFIWVCLWEMHIIASIAALIMVRVTIWLYRKGSRSWLIDQRAAMLIFGYTLMGVVLALFASFTSDIVKVFLTHTHWTLLHILTDHHFWIADFKLLVNPTILKGYTADIVSSVAFSAIGLYSTVAGILIPHAKAARQASTTPTQN